jgi:hypothetical protein
MPDAPPVTTATPRPAMFQSLVFFGCNSDWLQQSYDYSAASYLSACCFFATL